MWKDLLVSDQLLYINRNEEYIFRKRKKKQILERYELMHREVWFDGKFQNFRDKSGKMCLNYF